MRSNSRFATRKVVLMVPSSRTDTIRISLSPLTSTFSLRSSLDSISERFDPRSNRAKKHHLTSRSSGRTHLAHLRPSGAGDLAKQHHADLLFVLGERAEH